MSDLFGRWADDVIRDRVDDLDKRLSARIEALEERVGLRNIGGTVESFDWESISPLVLSTVVAGMAEVAEPDNPMVTNDAGMRFLRFLWRHGLEVVDVTQEPVAPISALRDDAE